MREHKKINFCFFLLRNIICLIILGVVLFQIQQFFFSFCGMESIIRKDPLKNPIVVVSVSKGILLLENGKKYKLAGIELSKKPKLLEIADKFIRTVTKQGVEIDRTLSDNSIILRCEPCFVFH